MNGNFLMPVFRNGEIIDGTLIHALSFCKEHCNKGKCKCHYELMKTAAPGFYMCPNGMSTYIVDSNEHFIFTAFREKNTYKKGGVLKSQEKVFNPVLNGIDVELTINNEILLLKSKLETIGLKTELENLIHDMKKLNSSIKTNCEDVWNENSEFSANDLEDKLRNIRVSSFMMSNRIKFFEIAYNPFGVSGRPVELVVFSKFDKFRKLLKGYLGKNVWIELMPENHYSYMLNEMFEMGLFSILENDIKYSPSGKPVKVFFKQNNALLDVSIISTGPFCSQEELNHLCDSGFRGEYAVQIDTTGKGLGLPFAKSVMEMNEVEMEFRSNYQYTDHHIKYGEFVVTLHFDKNRLQF